MDVSVFWDMKAVQLEKFLRSGSTVNSATYCLMLTKLQHAIRDKCSATNQHIRLLHDNARPHVSRPVQDKLQNCIIAEFWSTHHTAWTWHSLSSISLSP